MTRPSWTTRSMRPLDVLSVGRAFRMGGVSGSVSQNRRSDWDTLSALRLVRKLCPGIKAWNGMHFPVESLSGRCDPEFTLEVGCAFPTGPLKRKLRPIPKADSGIRFPDTKKATQRGLHLIYVVDAPMTSRASTPRRLPGDAERKVHREFRTSRRALNVLSVRAGLSEQGALRSAPPGRRTS